MKILVVTGAFPGKGAPMRGIFVRDQAEILSRSHDIFVYVPFLASLRSLPPAPDKAGTKYPLLWENMLGGQRIIRPLFTAMHRRKGLATIRSIIAKWGKPDVIHAHFAYPGGWIATQASKEFGIPVVLTEHSGGYQGVHNSFLMKKVITATLKEAAKIIAVSPCLASQMKMFLPAAVIEVVGNAVRTDIFTPTPPGQPGKARFFSAGNLLKAKGFEHLLKAAAILSGKGLGNFELVIAGAGPDAERLQHLSAVLKLDSFCTFTGELSRPEMLEQFRSCTAFVLPSLAETFSVACCEAMACGKPVIATLCGGPEYTVTPETGVLVPKADPASMARAMEGFAGESDSFNHAKIRESVDSRFGPAKFLETMSAIFRAVAGSTGTTD